MKKKKRILPVVLILLCAAALGAGVYFYPVWKSAVALRDHMELPCFSYELEMELDRVMLGEEQEKLLTNLAGLTGFGEDSLFCLTVKGSVWEDVIHVMVYPEGAQDPLIELYLSDGADVINETLPYNVIRRNLTARYGLLDLIMPDEKEPVYMTLEQAEQIFELDLDGIKTFRLPDMEAGQSVLGYFVLLAAMSREKAEEGNCYEWTSDQAWLRVEVPDSERTDQVRMHFMLREPGRLAGQKEEVLSRLGIELPGEQLSLLKNISGVIVPGAGGKLAVPDKLMDQRKADLLAEIREMIQKVVDFWR